MKQGHWLTIEKAFKGYRRNLVALKSYPYPYTAGIDYSNPKVRGDKYKNSQEQMVMSAIDKKSELEQQVKMVEEVIRWFEVEGYGRERYIKYRYVRGMNEYRACDELGISDRSGRRWKRDIFEKAEAIGVKIGLFG